jgi:hypothetical protein
MYALYGAFIYDPCLYPALPQLHGTTHLYSALYSLQVGVLFCARTPQACVRVHVYNAAQRNVCCSVKQQLAA